MPTTAPVAVSFRGAAASHVGAFEDDEFVMNLFFGVIDLLDDLDGFHGGQLVKLLALFDGGAFFIFLKTGMNAPPPVLLNQDLVIN